MDVHVCHGTKDNSYGKFTFHHDCDLVGIRFRHMNGTLERDANNGKTTKWGDGGFWTCITDSTNSILYPKNVNQWGWYSLPGFTEKDTLIYFNNHPSIKVVKGDEFRVWFGPDLKDQVADEDGTHGRHCMHVDVSCLV